jgi:hypothetical protein
MRRLTTTSCIKIQSEIYFKIPSVLLKVKRFKYHASMLDCDEGPESSGTGKKKIH